MSGTRPVWAGTSEAVRYPGLHADSAADVCVIGAGQAGLSAAYALASEGARVVVLDKAQPGAGESGRTSAHLTSWIDDGFDAVSKHHGAETARLVAQSHAAAVDWIEKVVGAANIDCGFRRIPLYWFAVAGGREQLEREHEATVHAGLSAVLDAAPLFDPFGQGAAMRLDNQATYNPLQFVHGLARAAERAGAVIHGDTFVRGVEGEGDGVRIETVAGAVVTARACVVATNTPISDYVSTHTKQAPYRTYVITLRIEPGSIPDAMYFDDLDPYHYARIVKEAGSGEYLLVGGEDHKVGQADDGAARFDRLESWAREHFQGVGERVHAWSGQVFEPADGLGLDGRDPSNEHVYMISGDSGDGLTNGVLGALLVTDLIKGRANAWESVYDPRRTPKDLKEFARENLNVAKMFALDRLSAGLGTTVDDLPRGAGRVIRRGTQAIAAYRANDGSLHECSALCTHMHCVVHWNSLENSWDCPCHGSRYEPTGEVIMGPAIAPLKSPEG